jgi:hypothetical protein
LPFAGSGASEEITGSDVAAVWIIGVLVITTTSATIKIAPVALVSLYAAPLSILLTVTQWFLVVPVIPLFSIGTQ